MTLDDFWKLPPAPPTDAQRIRRMKKLWEKFIVEIHHELRHDNNDYESPEVVLNVIARRRKDIARLMADPFYPEEEKMRLEFWSAYGDRIERNILNGSAIEYV